MQFLDTKHKRKSATITTIIMVLLMLILFFFGLKYLDPPIENGIAVNFGTSNEGSGEVQPQKVEEFVQENVSEEVVEEVVEEEVVPVEEEIVEEVEEVLTSESEESIKLKEIEENRKREAELKAAEEKKAQEEALRKQKEQDEKKKKLDAMFGGFNSDANNNSTSEGDGTGSGDKGSVNGDPNAKGYYGSGGSGGNGDYRLGDRVPLSKPKPIYECDEEGLVVVLIEVNREGKVIKATPGVKGSTNTAPCLLQRAKEAAMRTKWQPDANAGSKQIGSIRYRFSLED